MKKQLLTIRMLLVVAMLCLGVNVTWGVDVPTPVYFNDFSSTTGLTIVGNGEFVTDADPAFGKVFHNDPANASAIRTNYLQLPSDVLSHSTTSNEMTIGFWVNKKGENSFFYTPLFAAYGAAPNNGNGSPMFVCETRGLLQLNCSGYCDFGINDDPAGSTYNDGTPSVSTTWLDDAEWHYYAVALTATTAKVYVDGVLKNGWTVDGSSDGQVISGLFSNGSSLSYVTLGGNQAWTWGDPDPAFAFDDFAVYDKALSAEQIAQIMTNKSKAASSYTYNITYDFKSFVGAGEQSSAFTQSTTSVAGYTTLYKPNEFSDELGGKFAFQFPAEWTLRNTDSDKGLCFYRGSDTHFSIVGLKAGDKVTVTTSAGKIYFGTANQCSGTHISKSDYTTEENGANNQWDQLKSGATLTMLKDGTLNLQCKKNWVVISSIVIEPSQAEAMTAPSISSVATDGGRNVTITSGVSNMLSGVTTYYTTDGSIPTASSAKYTGTFLQTTTATIKAITISNSTAATESAVTEQEVNLDVVDNPVMSVTGTNNNNRIVTITCATDGATIYYSETEKANTDDGWSTYSTPVETSVATLYAYASKGSTKSEVVNIATGAGTTINLAAPTLTHSAANQYTISNDQSGILGAPTATVHYQIDGGQEQTSTSTSLNIPITADGTLTYWLTAGGYGPTAQTNANIYTSLPLAVVTTIDLCTTGAAEGNNWATKGDAVAVSEDGSHTYYKYTDQASKIVSEGYFAATFGNSTANETWRIQRYSGGTKNQNSAEHIAILNLKKEQVVRVMCDIAPTVNANATVLEGNTYTGTYSFTANADGNVVLNIAKNTVLTKIYVEQDYVSKTITSVGWATYCSPYALDLENATGLTDAYIVTGGNGSKLTKKSVKGGTVPANTGLLLKGDGTATIPVVASSATDVSANKLKGVTAETTLDLDDDDDGTPDKSVYVLMNDAENGLGFYRTSKTSFTLGANTAYLPLDFDAETPGARMSFLLDEVETTGIKTVQASGLKATGYYDLQGRRVSQPTKGMYIMNGKKVVIK